MQLVFIDLETGGLDWSKHPITQIAAVAVDAEFRELEAFEAKIDFARGTADPEALKVSSYSDEVWEREAKPALHVCNDLSRFFKRYADVAMVSRGGNPYFVAQLVGYNAASFDGPFLQAFYRQQDRFMPAAFRVLDVMQRVLWYFNEHSALPPPEDFKLATVCRYFGVDLTNAHDALADCRATVALCRALTAKELSAQQ